MVDGAGFADGLDNDPTQLRQRSRDHAPRRDVHLTHNGHRLPAGISRNAKGVICMGDASPKGPRTEKVRAS